MKNSKDFSDLGREKLEQLKTVFEEIEVQLSLGKAEAKELFERERKNLNTFINEQKLKFKKEEKEEEANWDNLIQKFEALEDQLSEVGPETKRHYDKMKKDTLHSIYELENAIRESYGELGVGMRGQLDHFKSILDTYRIQFALSDFNTQEESNNRKEALKQAVKEVRDRINKEVEDGNKLDDFTKEMSTSLDHMKKAFSDLFS